MRSKILGILANTPIFKELPSADSFDLEITDGENMRKIRQDREIFNSLDGNLILNFQPNVLNYAKTCMKNAPFSLKFQL